MSSQAVSTTPLGMSDIPLLFQDSLHLCLSKSGHESSPILAFILVTLLLVMATYPNKATQGWKGLFPSQFEGAVHHGKGSRRLVTLHPHSGSRERRLVFTSLFPGHAARDPDLWNGAAHTRVCLPIPVTPTCRSLTDAPRRRMVMLKPNKLIAKINITDGI